MKNPRWVLRRGTGGRMMVENIKTMKPNTPYRVTKGNTDGGIVAGDIVSYDSKCLVMWDGKYTGMYDDEDLSIPQISDFECELAED